MRWRGPSRTGVYAKRTRALSLAALRNDCTCAKSMTMTLRIRLFDRRDQTDDEVASHAEEGMSFDQCGELPIGIKRFFLFRFFSRDS